MASIGSSSGNSETELLEYPIGGTDQVGSLSPPKGYIFTAPCSADPTTGNIAIVVGTAGSLQKEHISVFSPGSETPKDYTNPSFANYFAVGYDTHGNLFVTGETSGSAYASLAELPSGANAFRGISLTRHIGFGPLEWHGKYLTSQQSALHHIHFPTTIYRIAITGSSGTVVGSTALKGASGYGWIEGDVAIAPQRGKANEGHVAFYKYPKGGKPESIYDGMPPVSSVTVATEQSR